MRGTSLREHFTKKLWRTRIGIVWEGLHELGITKLPPNWGSTAAQIPYNMSEPTITDSSYHSQMRFYKIGAVINAASSTLALRQCLRGAGMLIDELKPLHFSPCVCN